jgi:hypothetical protein
VIRSPSGADPGSIRAPSGAADRDETEAISGNSADAAPRDGRERTDDDEETPIVGVPEGQF